MIINDYILKDLVDLKLEIVSDQMNSNLIKVHASESDF